MTQVALSSCAGIGRATFARVETGEHGPRTETLTAIARALGVEAVTRFSPAFPSSWWDRGGKVDIPVALSLLFYAAQSQRGVFGLDIDEAAACSAGTERSKPRPVRVAGATFRLAERGLSKVICMFTGPGDRPIS